MAARRSPPRERSGSSQQPKPAKAPLAAGGAREAIYDRILRAMLEHRLPPGTQLVEDRLAELFDTNRSQVREVLARLAVEGLVTTVMNRGAFVSAPTFDQTRNVFEARRLIEPGLVRRLIDVQTKAAISALKRVVADEVVARGHQDRAAIVRLAGEFHMVMAHFAGNELLANHVRTLTTLSCLAVFLYDAPHATACREDEHALIVQAIVDRDPDQATELMLEHLRHAEAALDFRPRQEGPVDLFNALS